MLEFRINGKEVTGEKGETVLQVATREGFVIPTLCHHENLGSDGRCRLCVVQIKKGNRTRMVTSCLYPVEKSIEVFTETEDVMLARRTVLELLLSRCPDAEQIQYLAGQYGIKEVRYIKDKDKGKCILCNLCVRTCEVLVGVSALGMSGKGPAKKVTTPFNEPSDACIGCGACVVVCPTSHIYMEDRNGIRTVWNKKFELARCPRCGRFHSPTEQLQFIAEKSGTSMDQLIICQECK